MYHILYSLSNWFCIKQWTISFSSIIDHSFRIICENRFFIELSNWLTRRQNWNSTWKLVWQRSMTFHNNIELHENDWTSILRSNFELCRMLTSQDDLWNYQNWLFEFSVQFDDYALNSDSNISKVIEILFVIIDDFVNDCSYKKYKT